MSGKILIYRFSSFGDVLITIPVIISALEANHGLHIVFVTRIRFVGYVPLHERLTVVGLDLENDYSGLHGIYKIYKLLISKAEYKLAIDLHNVLRTKLLSFLLRIQKLNVYTLNKNRRSKRNFISGKDRTALPSTMERYLMVFNKAGLNFRIENPGHIFSSEKEFSKETTHSYHIGLAPFARHATKAWSIENFVNLISILNKQRDIQYYIFGAESEFVLASVLIGSNVHNYCGTLTPTEEISLIKQLNVMVSMDSANMHLADILGIPVVSIWGGTHADIGFRPSFQKKDDLISSPIQIDCRPCSVYGKKDCKLKSNPFYCLTSIKAEEIATKILHHL